MIEEILSKEEGKSLEFKENTQSLQKIIQTVIAFANTAGGTMVLGIRDRTKEVVGLENILEEEERLANAIADSIFPPVYPTFQMHTYRSKDLKSKGIENGTYVRFGSTNRIAPTSQVSEIQRLKAHQYFDELPASECSLEKIDFDLARELFSQVSKKLTEDKAKSLGLLVQYQGKIFPTQGAVLLFSRSLSDFFPNSVIRLGRFSGTNKSHILDQQEVQIPLTLAEEAIVAFIYRHTNVGAEISSLRRKDVYQYPQAIVREAVLNALLHADYSIRGMNIQVAIFDDRIEITNPGGLPFGLTLDQALSGISQLRNHVIGRIFRELKMVEQWGSGLGRMIDLCKQTGCKKPTFEEEGTFFRVTLYPAPIGAERKEIRAALSAHFLLKQGWEDALLNYLEKEKKITPKVAQKLWNVTPRTTSSRLKKMCEEGQIAEISTGPFDPKKVFTAR